MRWELDFETVGEFKEAFRSGKIKTEDLGRIKGHCLTRKDHPNVIADCRGILKEINRIENAIELHEECREDTRRTIERLRQQRGMKG
jgi:hypothetical protein